MSLPEKITSAELGQIGEPVPVSASLSSKRAEMEETSLFDTAKRRGQIARAKHQVVLAGIYIGALLILAFVIIRVWHIVMPVEQQWLTFEALSKIDSTGVSALFGAVVAIGIEKFIEKNKDG